MADGVVDRIVGLFEARGNDAYYGESVSQTEHALQSAALAEAEGAPGPLIVAALLHDLGHLVHGLDEHIAERGIDGHHEAAGEAWLAQHFGPEVTEPVRLHVEAKRYLCAVQPEYLDGLSPASVQSLRLQGGPLTPQEVTAFESNRYAQDAVRLRRWDDTAKVPGLDVPGLDHYRPLLESALRA